MSVHESVREVLAETTGALQRWAGEHRDVADIDLDNGDGYWRLDVRPFALHACPFELVVHADGVHYDIAVDTCSYAGLRTRNIQLLPVLVSALVAGRVVTARWRSIHTGLLHSVETTISPEDAACDTWRQTQHVEAVSQLLDSSDCERHAKHYVPYRRG